MTFTAKDVATLREMTGAGMMDCKKALQETGGNMDEAVNYLRKKGIASAAKKAGNIAAEGLLACKLSADGKTAALVEVNCQTDFVAKTDGFKDFVNQVAQAAFDNKTDTVEKLLNAKINGKALSEMALETSAKTGEKVDIRRVAFLQTNGIIGAYVHPVGSKIGTLVAISGEDLSKDKAVDVAMHIAAASPAPEFRSKEEIPADVIAKEKEIESGKEDLKGKPAEIIEKIVAGRVDKLLASKVLVEQPFIKDPNQKISQYLGKATVEKFLRLNLGEGIEKKQSNLAEEVAAMMSSSAH
jgi:elongation factor Ts